TTRRTLTVVLGLCVFAILYNFTPSDSSSFEQGWQADRPSSLTLEQKEAALLRLKQQHAQTHHDRQERERIMKLTQEHENQREEELERIRLKEEEEEEEEDGRAINHDRILFDKHWQKESGQETIPKDDTPSNDYKQEGEWSVENLPTEFNESLFPMTSQKLLESKIGVQALDSYIFYGKPQMVQARDAAIAFILGQANIAYRNTSIYSVVIKPKDKIPPSGDIHDYSSLARYFWKNPKTADGLPYVRLDGKPNPDMDSVWDYRLLRKVFRDCYYMGQAYFWTGDERYAKKIIHRVKQWFLDEETRMNPNVKYGSLIFGNNLGRAQGVLDMFKVYG
ncbi:hypothetical protein BGZ65_012438, partial [Modicella reniformis]